jgi:hypothetical protein
MTKEARMQIPPELKTVLKRLKLSGMLATLPDRWAYARQEKLDYPQFLELVLSDEVERRDHKHIANFQLPTNWACGFMTASTSLAAMRDGMSRAHRRELFAEVSLGLSEISGNYGCAVCIPGPFPC